MSIEAVSTVLSMEVSDSTAKLVLVGLANHCDASGECYPSQARLGRYASCCRQTVNRKIRWLEANGFIEKRTHRLDNGGRTSSRYRLILPPVADGDTPCRDGATPPVATVRHKPSLEPSKNSLSDARASSLDALQVDDELLRWFDANAPNVDPAELLEELRLYCESSGKVYVNYRATLKKWALREKGKGNEQRNSTAKQSPHNTQFAAFGSLAAGR